MVLIEKNIERVTADCSFGQINCFTVFLKDGSIRMFYKPKRKDVSVFSPLTYYDLPKSARNFCFKHEPRRSFSDDNKYHTTTWK